MFKRRGIGHRGPMGRHGGDDLFATATDGRRSGRGERGFAHGRLRFVLLQLIAEKPAHGYELIKAIEDKTAGAYVPSPGVVYPTLTLLEELGHVTVAENESNRKLYTITAAGKKCLQENKTVLAEVTARMGKDGMQRGHDLAPQIIRAMENLKTALRLRLSHGELNSKQIQAIAAALDAAASHVENS